MTNIYFSWFWRLECPKLCFVVCEGLLPGSQMVVFSLCYMVEGALDLWSLFVCAQSYLTLCDPWTIVHQVPLSLEFSRQENWGGLPFPSPGDLSNPGIKPASLVSPALAGMFFFTTLPPIRALILFMKAPSS